MCLSTTKRHLTPEIDRKEKRKRNKYKKRKKLTRPRNFHTISIPKLTLNDIEMFQMSHTQHNENDDNRVCDGSEKNKVHSLELIATISTVDIESNAF